MAQTTRRVRSATAPEAVNHAGATPLPPAVAQQLIAQILAGQTQGAQPATAKELKGIAQYLQPVSELQLTPQQKAMIAEIADGAGHPVIAKALRGEPYKDGFWQTMKTVGAKNIKVRHVVYAVAIGTVAFLVWEGIAYKFDLPRFGVFDPKMPGRR